MRKLQTDELESISIQDWRRGQRWVDAVAGNVRIAWTRLPSGGKRPWFRCPSCDRRCGILYSIRSCIICRTCGDLSYESQNEPRHFRALTKAQKIRIRLGGSANMTEPFPRRPRYMHFRTYQNLISQYAAAAEQYESQIALRFQIRGAPYCN